MANDETRAMALQLKARVQDLINAIDASDRSLEAFASRIDRIDDQVYLLQVEIEQGAASEPMVSSDTTTTIEANDDGTVTVEQQQVERSVDEAGNESETVTFTETKIGNFTISPEMKETMRDGARAVGEVVKDGREVFGEITDTLGDLKDVFNFKKGPTNRRR